MQSFTARMPLTAFRLWRRRWSSPQQCYLHYFRNVVTMLLTEIKQKQWQQTF